MARIAIFTLMIVLSQIAARRPLSTIQLTPEHLPGGWRGVGEVEVQGHSGSEERPVDTMTLYDVLGVSQDASETEIRQQYQELARQYHPDKSGVEGAKEKFLQVTEAWHVLGDTQKRREYDDQLKREKLYQEFPVSEELFLEDLEQDKEGGVYLHTCRCGGHYTLAAQDARSSTEKEVVVACDNCSLSILVLLNCDENT
ncbi:DnaJ subfamily C member 24 [Portunus trituberculatus]|uniref:DnaJ subfamily C member 24 n=2 Tax=Portuninae TaxID=600346 RepID=A0A5B7D3A3_PORTR|nr:DnaJ subfamily C member 24 [Portunus trituberculatus]